ncbi:MAG: serine/threonine protein kinase, partial [Myxococcaceae bacterium]|nr:serine/threonine protein kinase [Myxococcaceae bacterium]
MLIAGRYRVEAALGKGGAAQVYRVRDLVSHAELALKRLKPGASQKLTRLFEREYQTLASLNHPGTVEVFDYGRDEEGPFYTMELLQGEDLKARSPMPWREACGYLRDAAQTLGLLHARKLIHRDVSARNLWRMPNGHAKLLDFGAVMPFGPNDHLLGTPPLVPPEALRGERLDQRADLYSLGAVGYYLLCGTHAFPAREFEDLHALWKQPPEPVSERVARLARPELEDIPPELDQLLGALLSPEVLARPSNTPELIDRLDTLLDGDRPSQVEVAELHLSNTAYVGREGARRHLHRQLQVAALGGRGQSTVLQGAPGQGRSRLLKELALQARVLPATVLLVPVANYPGLYGVATALALKLLDALPEQARAAALPHAGLLAHASSRLRERLGVQPVPALEAVELRVRIQAAFRDWFLQVAKRHALVLLIDGFEQVDDGSGAFLLALAQARKGARLMLVCTLLDERKRVHGALTRALQKTSHQRVLSGLSEPETLALLHSVFDGAEHVPRLASRLHKATEGNPGHLLELCRQLVSRNVIGFSHGSWLLPQEVALEHLASTREQALTARLLQLSSAARKLGRVLSAYPGPVPPELARALAETLSPNALLALGELQNEDVLSQDEAGLHFLHEPVRLQLASELTPTQRHAAQRAIGHYLSSLPAPSLVERLCAGVNLLASADQRGADMIASASLRMALGEPAQLRYALPYLEEGLRLFRAQKRPAREQIALLVALSMAGYYCDRRYALRYGELTIGALEEVLGLERARKLSHVWGKKLSLWMALAIAAIQLGVRRANPRVPSFRDALLLLFACVGTLAGSAAVCLDAEAAQRYGEVLSPFQALGPRSMAGFVYEYCSALSASLRDAWGAALFRWQQLIARLDRGEVRDMPESLRVRFLGGALFTSGVLQAQRDGEAALRTAERLEQLGMALDRMSADQVRTVFYAHQGNAALFGEYAERAELHAIQQGSSWQIETWFASSKSAVDLRTRDLMGQKHASEQLQRMSQTVPSLDLAARRARGAYLMMRKKYAEALPWLEECLQEEPLSTAGWSCMHGVLARTYNKLGEFERARTTCLRALSVLKPEDFVLTGMYLIVQTE